MSKKIKKYIFPIIVTIIVLGFIVYMWNLYGNKKSILIEAGNAGLWIIISILCFLMAAFIIFYIWDRENLYSMLRKILNGIAESEDNTIQFQKENYSLFTRILARLGVEKEDFDGIVKKK